MQIRERARVCVLCETRYGRQAQPAGLIRVLRDRGHAVEVFDPGTAADEVGLAAWPAVADLVVARGRSRALLAALLYAERLGVRTINARAAIDGVHNKLDMAVTLATGGLPVPPTWLAAPSHLARRIPPSAYPIVLKPIFGDNANGLRLVSDARELAGLQWVEPVALAQRYLTSDGSDVKLYGIGERLFAVRKPSPFCPGRRPTLTEVKPLSLTAEFVGLGERCRRLFGLELFGVDCLQTADGVVVIEVNEFPNYTGIPDADELLADHVLARLPVRRSWCGSPS